MLHKYRMFLKTLGLQRTAEVPCQQICDHVKCWPQKVYPLRKKCKKQSMEAYKIEELYCMSVMFFNFSDKHWGYFIKGRELCTRQLAYLCMLGESLYRKRILRQYVEWSADRDGTDPEHSGCQIALQFRKWRKHISREKWATVDKCSQLPNVPRWRLESTNFQINCW